MNVYLITLISLLYVCNYHCKLFIFVLHVILLYCMFFYIICYLILYCVLAISCLCFVPDFIINYIYSVDLLCFMFLFHNI